MNVSKFNGVRIMTAGIVLMSGSATFAQGPDFEKRKAEHLAEIDQRIQKMQEHRNCVSSATNHEALRKCRDSMREWHKEERQERQKKSN